MRVMGFVSANVLAISLAVLLAVGSLSGCTDPVPADMPFTDVSFTDQGRLCAFAGEPSVFGPDEPQVFAADDPVELMVVMEECVSGSCTEDITSACEARVDGTTIEVTSQGSYRDTTGSGPCTADCRPVFATCPTPPLAAGSYDVVHGAATLTLAIPGETQAPPCIDTP